MKYKHAMRLMSLIIVTTLVIISSGTASASAAWASNTVSISVSSLVPADLNTVGDNLLTIDTATGLVWLDLTVTDGQSFNQVKAKLGYGGTLEGFRFATLAEVVELWENAGIDISGLPSPEPKVENFGPVFAFQELVGFTDFGPNTWDSGGHVADTNAYGDHISPFARIFVAGIYVGTGSVFISGTTNPDIARPNFGSWLVLGTPPIDATIDIKPGSDSNPINSKSNGNIPVAILSSPGFDAPSMADTASLTFGKTGDESSLAGCNSDGEDIDGDGLLDLVCNFYTQATRLQIGDTEGILKGHTVGGTYIEGRDSVTVVIANGPKELVDVCHNPGSDETTIEVPISAVDTHASHGDLIGYSCGTIVDQCTDGWTSTFSDTTKTYILEVNKDTLEGRSTIITTVGRADESLQVFVTSLIYGNTWSFDSPSCGTSCGYLLGWYGGTSNPIGEGTGIYKIEITQAQEGPVNLYCVD